MSIDNVADVSRRAQYTAANGQTEFPYTFPIFDEDDLVVQVDGATQTITTDYTVDGVEEDAGGNVTFVVAMSGGEIVTIYSETSIQRTSDFQQNGPNLSAVMNDELDRITVVQQELREGIRRAIRFPMSSAGSAADSELSPIDSWFERYLFVNSAGELEPAENLETTTLTQSVIGELLYPRTAAEIAAGVTPTNYAYPWLDIRRYGAVSGGTAATITTAIQNAIDSATENGTVYIPPGEWTINATLDVGYTDLWHSVHIRGDGNASQIIWDGGNDDIMIHVHGTSGAGWYSKMLFENFLLYCDSYTGDGHSDIIGIQLGDSPEDVYSGIVNATIRHVTIRRPSIGILGYYESDEVVIENNYIDHHEGYGIWADHAGVNWHVINNHVSDGAPTSTGIRVSLYAAQVVGNVVQGVEFSVGIQVDRGPHGPGPNPKCVRVSDNYIECQLDNDYGIILYGCDTAIVENNYFTGCRGGALISLNDENSVSCNNVTIGPNFHAASGGNIAALVTATAGTTQSQILGHQETDGAVTTITGPFVINFQDGVIAADEIDVVDGAITNAVTTGIQTTNFGLGLTPIPRQSTIADPAGGGTVDAEARTAINTLIDRLQAFGLIS